MAIIDSQVHVYEANTPKRPWHTVPNWPDHVTGDELVAEEGLGGSPIASSAINIQSMRTGDTHDNE
jgi:hypothetical protein